MPSVRAATDVSALTPRVDTPASSEPVSGDASTFATALEAAHGQVAPRDTRDRRLEEHADRSTRNDDDRREGVERRATDTPNAKSSGSARDVGARPTEHPAARGHKAAHRAVAASAEARHVAASGTKTDTASAAQATDATHAAVSIAGKTSEASGDGDAAAATEGGVDARAVPPGTVGPPSATNTVAGKVEATATTATAAVSAPAEGGAEAAPLGPQPALADVPPGASTAAVDQNAAGRHDGHTAGRVDPTPEAGTSPATKTAADGGRHGAPAAVPHASGEHASADAPPSESPSNAGEASVSKIIADGTSERAVGAAADARVALDTAPREAAVHAPTAQAKSLPAKPIAERTSGPSESSGADTEAAATIRAGGSAAHVAAQSAEARPGGARTGVDLGSGRHVNAHHHLGAPQQNAVEADTIDTAIDDGSEVLPSAATAETSADGKVAVQRLAGSATSAARLHVTADARTDVEPGRVGAGAPGAAEQVAANATNTEGRTAGTSAAASAERPAVPVRGDTSVAASWAERVVESVRVATLRGGGEMRLRLEPAGLGNIDVRISLAHDGVRASIVAEHDSTRALLRNEQHLLHAALERSDLRLAGFSVDLGSGGSNSAFADVEQQPRWSEEGAAERPPDVPPEIVTMDAPVVSGRLSVRV